MSTSPYRVPQAEPPPGCDRCGEALPEPSTIHEGKRGEPICRACFLGQYDLLALFGVGALTAGAITSSGPVFLSGILIPVLCAYAIYKGRV